MKKRNFKFLQLNKKPISNLNALEVKGGRNSHDTTCPINGYNLGCNEAEEEAPDLYTSYLPTEEGGGVPSQCGADA